MKMSKVNQKYFKMHMKRKLSLAYLKVTGLEIEKNYGQTF